MEEVVSKHTCGSTQLALEWVLHQGDELVPIPGVIMSFHFLINGQYNICTVMVHIVYPKDSLSNIFYTHFHKSKMKHIHKS